ncbi:MAG: transglutaminase-like domain-containing protein [Lachnospiraceae bacterium]|nr:transglutaminase-like domain-containing protein [Lachnospiraceae bacterium]
MLLFKKKEALPPTYPYGFAIPEQPGTVCSSKALVCLMKGLLIFASSYGAIGGVLSAFQLPCYPALVLILLLFFSILMAFLHYSRLMFNLFYPVIFIAFTYFIFSFRYSVNSGYQAFINILQQTYGDYYLLDTYRESTEFFSDRAMTITFAAGFIGFFLILLLNIFISEYMSLFAVIMLTFPLFQLGIYVDKMPSAVYFILLIFSYFMVGILRCSRHFLLPYREKKWTEFKFTDKDKTIRYRYHASGKIFLQLTGVFLAFTLLIGLMVLPLVSATHNSKLSSSRRSMDEYMKAFTQNGLSAFFDRYAAKGGISGGQLGGVSSVRPDYESDLNVTFVPSSYDPLYLKAYTGAHYTGYSWEKPDYPVDTLKQMLGDDFETYSRFHAFLEGTRIAHAAEANHGKLPYAKIRVENLDADSSYYYLPYYVDPNFDLPCQIDRGTIYPDAPFSEMELSYYPVQKKLSPGEDDSDALLYSLSADDAARDYIQFASMYDKLNYMDIPENLRDYLESLHPVIGTGKDLEEQVQLIADFFAENYPYSQTPGTTPMDADFVRYFLETQKRGYCAHFASAGTLLLRSYGYPARYVEGYSVSVLDISNGENLESESYDDWYSGQNPLGKSGVVSVPVSDASAHAWCEVYVDNFGWVPCEFTPASSEEESDAVSSGFWDLFSGLFSLSGQTPDAVNNSSQTTETLQKSKEHMRLFMKNSVFRPLVIFLLLLFSALLVYLLIKAATTFGRMKLQYRKGDHAPLLSYRYRSMCRKMLRLHPKKDGSDFLLPSGLWHYHETVLLPAGEKTLSAFKKNRIETCMERMEKALFSKQGLTKQEADEVLLFLQQYQKAIK